MRLFIEEMKKIWRPFTIIAVIVVSGLMGFLFLEYDIKYFLNGHPDYEEYAITTGWIEKYGTTLEENEFMEAQKELKYIQDKTNKYIEVSDLCKSYNIKNYDEYTKTVDSIMNDGKANTEEDEKLIKYIVSAECEYIGCYLFSYKYIFEQYEERKNKSFLELVDGSEEQIKRVKEIYNSTEGMGILFSRTVSNFQQYAQNCMYTMLVGVFILLSPCLTKDNQCKIKNVQFSSKKGRNTVKTQLLAYIASGMGLYIIELLIMSVLYSKSGIVSYLNSPINGFMGDLLWFDMTLGQYIFCTIVLSMVIMISSIGIIFMMSSVSKSYISLLLKCLPCLFLFINISSFFINIFLRVYNNFGIKNADIICVLAILVVSIASIIMVVRSKKRCQI